MVVWVGTTGSLLVRVIICIITWKANTWCCYMPSTATHLYSWHWKLIILGSEPPHTFFFYTWFLTGDLVEELLNTSMNLIVNSENWNDNKNKVELFSRGGFSALIFWWGIELGLEVIITGTKKSLWTLCNLWDENRRQEC